jgi:hypothetical protein
MTRGALVRAIAVAVADVADGFGHLAAPAGAVERRLLADAAAVAVGAPTGEEAWLRHALEPTPGL